MRFPRHWSLRYFGDKTLATSYACLHPKAPWLTRHAVRALDARIEPSMEGFEWGAGRSTIWIARRLARLVSIEHSPEWHARVARMLERSGATNVALRLTLPDPDAYVAPITETPDATLDIVLVDGISVLRDRCVLAAIPKLKPGGMLVLDDAQRYLPRSSRSPEAIGPNAEPPTLHWASVAAALNAWPLIWTSDGVKDTAIWTKT